VQTCYQNYNKKSAISEIRSIIYQNLIQEFKYANSS